MNRGRLGLRLQVAEDEWDAEGQAEGLDKRPAEGPEEGTLDGPAEWPAGGATAGAEERPAEGPEEGAQDGPAEWPAGGATAGAEHPQYAGHVGEDNMDAQEHMEATAGGRGRG